ncbi:DUF1572 domain-containing protein [bacterium]|nr:DUF1572 domain-containing protein [bacterium]
MSIEKIYLEDSIARFKEMKGLAEKAIAQIRDDDFLRIVVEESNSMATIVKHINGNLRSRWTDFLTTDGEKPDRNRDSEFEPETEDTRDSLMNRWEASWKILFNTLNSLKESDLTKTVTIRGQEHKVVEAINRQLTHYGYHVGQIVFLAKFFASSNWQTLSIPRRR